MTTVTNDKITDRLAKLDLKVAMEFLKSLGAREVHVNVEPGDTPEQVKAKITAAVAGVLQEINKPAAPETPEEFTKRHVDRTHAMLVLMNQTRKHFMEFMKEFDEEAKVMENMASAINTRVAEFSRMTPEQIATLRRNHALAYALNARMASAIDAFTFAGIGIKRALEVLDPKECGPLCFGDHEIFSPDNLQWWKDLPPKFKDQLSRYAKPKADNVESVES